MSPRHRSQEHLKLSEHERASLTYDLLLRLSPPESEVDQLDWNDLLDARISAADRGDFAPGEWREQIAAMRKSLKNQ